MALSEAGDRDHQPPLPDAPAAGRRVGAWANAKTVLAGVGGLAVSLGQILLHVDDEPLTSFVPSWTIMMYCCGAVWAGAFYAPALYAMIVTSTLPAAVWLLPQGDIERAPAFACWASCPSS